MKKSLLFLAGFSVVAMTANADKLKEGYITWPGSEYLVDYVQQWNGGAGNISINGQTWEDENFFISRVKPKVRFYNTATQVDPSRTQYNPNDGSGTDKRYIWWVPIGDCPPDGSYHSNAFPNGTFDGEAFSMWSYVDHYGNWTSPWGWAPGAFADAAHKNGVAVSGVASVPFGGISANWKAAFEKIGNVTGEQVGKFLYYHGVDGLGYNSEWSGYAPTGTITPLHDGLATYMASRNPIFENVWYAGTIDSGSCNFDIGVNSNHDKLFKNASMFLNYNWNNTVTIENSVKYAKGVNRNPFFIYAGMNQQGGEPRGGDNYPMLKDYQYSIGVWGAHNYNMFWQGRTEEGASLSAVQRCYLNKCERWFTNGKRNPAIKMEITTNRGHRPEKDFAGMSSMMTARSSMGWDLTGESFITYFNLGNGQFFNIEGDRVSDKGWYNIGMQDYLPTWRWWFAPEFLQGNVTEGSTHMTADFTWDDAYFGGSCLQIAGSTTKEYLHLFKTNFKVGARMKIRVRYKLLEGEGDVKVVISKKGAETTPISSFYGGKELSLCTVANSAEVRDASLDRGKEGWQTIELNVSPRDVSGDASAFGTELQVVALEIQNAKNLKLELGEFSIINTATSVPGTPEIKLSKVLYQDMNGVDGKLIWNMPNTKETGEPVYNSDVKTSYFKVYAQEEGGEPQFMNATTSWASIVFSAPSTDNSKKIRFGVSAVGMRHDAESEIAWSDYMDKGEYTGNDRILIDKTTIKPNETFTIYYADPQHASSSFKLYNDKGEMVAKGDGNTWTVEGGLANVGGYDLVVDEGTDNEQRMGYFVQISGAEVGALPEILSISHNGVEITDNADVHINAADVHTLGYTGRQANGQASRALMLNQGHIGCANKELMIQAQESFSMAGWFKFDDFPNKSFAFLNITNKAGAWPNCNWGWCWSNVDPDGQIHITFRGNATDGGAPGEMAYSFPKTRLLPNIWTHLAMICEYHPTEGFRFLLYVNGVLQESEFIEYTTWHNSVKTTGTTEDFCPGRTFAMSQEDDFIFGGVAYQGSAVEGQIDDFQIWKKAMTAEDVKTSMTGLSRNNIPEGLAGYWDFESDADENYKFASLGTDPSLHCYNFDLGSLEGEGRMEKLPKHPAFTSGCPFLVGTAYPVTTTAKWEDTEVRTQFNKVASRAEGDEDVAGQAAVTFKRDGDHVVTLTLSNSYGEDVREFPVFVVEGTSAIGGVAADEADFSTYTIDDVLFVEFAQDGAYNVEVYNTAGMLVGNANLNAVAGQGAQVTLGTPGVYLVRVSLNGQVLRTIKVLRK